MKKIVSILLIALNCLKMAAIEHSYTTESVLADGHWVKIRVSESGVCRMSYSELRSAGIDPAAVKVFGYGGGQKTQDFSVRNIDDLPQVPVYRGEDYILFYVQGKISWSYDSNVGRYVHTRNTYSEYGYYFLTDSEIGSDTFPTAEAVSGTPNDISSYDDYQVHDYDSINLVDRSGESGGGKYFYGEQFAANKQRVFRFSTPNAIAGTNSTVFIDVAGHTTVGSYFYGSVNDGAAKSTYIRAAPDHYSMAETGTITLTGSVAEKTQQVALQLQSSSSGALGWLNYIELTTPSQMRMTGSWMPLRSTANRGKATPVRYHLSNAKEGMEVWDITALDKIKRMPALLNNGELTWVGSQADGVHEYVAVDPSGENWVKAEVVGEVKNQNLHRLNNIDYVIICPEGYEAIATDLAKAHEEKQAITWAVVTDQEVYNEFSSGTPDATAYRWLMKMLYDRGNKGIGEKPRWLLLMGHGTFDNRKLIAPVVANSGTNLLLTYQSNNSVNEVRAYATDDYFGWLDNEEGTVDNTAKLDIGIGRLPVNNTAEARTIVDKIIRYMANGQKGKWKNQFVYLADDGENGMHTRTAEESAELVRIKNPDFVVHKIFLDAYPQEVNASGESYPLAKNKVLNLLRSGVLFFDYSGHGGYNAITSESIMNLKDIDGLKNENLAFWLFVTCNFGQFDGGKRCAAEAAVMNPNGGAIGILSATRTVYADQNTALNKSICDTLFGHSSAFNYNMTLGEAIAIGKNNVMISLDNGNRLPYILLGDPALRLNFPTDYQVETTTKIDTLNALSVQHVEGRIVDEDKQPVSDFNGKVDITIYDKMQSIPTRDNDNAGGDPEVVAYNDYPSIIFSGATEVKDGLFDYTFMVPKDIRYNYGNGRIVYYAYDYTQGEAVGHFEDFTVGGTGSILSADTTGPTMRIYLNSPAFEDGGVTYATPRFYADLYDEHGINTAGAGIGHDLMLVIDNDPKQTYSINEYFTAEDNSYQKGQVSYLISQLENGPHRLTFRAWDLLNNSTTQALNFVVESGIDPSIYSVATYPNPVQQSGVMNMTILYDQPDELLSTEVYLYNISGQMVWSHKQNNPEGIQLNLAEMGLLPGVYVYNVRLKSANSKYSRASGKIIVTK